MNNKNLLDKLIFYLGELTLDIYELKKREEEKDVDFKEACEYLEIPNLNKQLINSLEERKELIIKKIIEGREKNE